MFPYLLNQSGYHKRVKAAQRSAVLPTSLHEHDHHASQADPPWPRIGLVSVTVLGRPWIFGTKRSEHDEPPAAPSMFDKDDFAPAVSSR